MGLSWSSFLGLNEGNKGKNEGECETQLVYFTVVIGEDSSRHLRHL